MFVCGINPCIFLYSPNCEEMIFASSYWHIDYSDAGVGSVIFMRDLRRKDSVIDVCTDNEDLGNFLHENFNSKFTGFDLEECKLEFWLFDSINRMDGDRHQYRTYCKSSKKEVDLIWRDFDTPELIVDELSSFGKNGNKKFLVSSMIIPCKSASIRIDGDPIEGCIGDQYGQIRSTAFLAMAESWASIK